MPKQQEIIAHAEAQAPLPSPGRDMTPMQMLDRAVQLGAPVETLERLMGLQERWEANQSRKSFDAAIATAKAEIPVILKEKRGHNYKYEDLAAIARVIDPILAKNGLSYRFKSESNGEVKVTCILCHRDGHNEENSLSSQPDTSGQKNNIQAIGSAVTYLQRYTLKLALGLAAEKDDDAKVADSEPITSEQAIELEALIKKSDVKPELFFGWLKVDGILEIPARHFERAKTELEQKIKEKEAAK